MLANAELSPDFYILNRQYKELVSELLIAIDLQAERLEIEPSANEEAVSLDGDKFYFVEQGTLSVRYRHSAVYLADKGDLILPDVAGGNEADAKVSFLSADPTVLQVYPALEFMSCVFNDLKVTKLWTRLMVTYQGLTLRLAAILSGADAELAPAFEIFEAGTTIIEQDDTADYVFNLIEGQADVLVDGVTVGAIGEGEIFGAMAVLTNAPRHATITAKSRCVVVKVAKEKFAEMIKSNPATIMNLLTDMANTIDNQNKQLIGMQDSFVN